MPLAVALQGGKVLLICPYLETYFHLENFLHIPQSFSLRLDFQLLQIFRSPVGRMVWLI